MGLRLVGLFNKLVKFSRNSLHGWGSNGEINYMVSWGGVAKNIEATRVGHETNLVV